MTERLSFIERQQKTLEAYIDGPLRKHFLSKEYIDGVCEKKNELYLQQGKAAGRLFSLTTALAFFDYFNGQSIALFGTTIVVAPFFAAILCLIVASAFFASVSITLDVLIIDSYLRTIGQSAGLFSFELYTLNKSAINLWGAAMTPKYFGPVSGRTHHWAFGTVGLAFLAITTVFAMFPTLVCGLVAWSFLVDPTSGWAVRTYAGTSLLLLFLSWLFILFFVSKYKFSPADFSESNMEPTAEFVARTEKEADQETSSSKA